MFIVVYLGKMSGRAQVGRSMTQGSDSARADKALPYRAVGRPVKRVWVEPALVSESESLRKTALIKGVGHENTNPSNES
jgi:hypothetical protein